MRGFRAGAWSSGAAPRGRLSWGAGITPHQLAASQRLYRLPEVPGPERSSNSFTTYSSVFALTFRRRAFAISRMVSLDAAAMCFSLRVDDGCSHGRRQLDGFFGIFCSNLLLRPPR